MKTFLLSLVLFFQFICIGQTSVPIRALSIGDSVPIQINIRLLNDQNTKAELNDFNEKLSIIDFWATYCSPCIPGLYKLDSLQRLFQDKIKVIAVTYQDKNVVEQFVKKRNWQIAFAAEDTLLKQLFPYHSMPHIVWIRNGKIKAFTSSSQISVANIQNILADYTKDIQMKKEDLSYDNSYPLFVNGNGGDGSKQLYRSLFTPYLEGLRVTYFASRNSNGEVTRINMINSPVLMLFKHAWGRQFKEFMYDNRLSIDVSDSSLLYYLKNRDIDTEEWNKRNSYCYTLDVPKGFKGDLLEIMQQDLNRFFGGTLNISASIVKQRKRCLVLRVFNSELVPTAVNDSLDDSMIEGQYKISNLPFDRFYSGMLVQHRNNQLPIINLTGISGNVTMKLPADFTNIDSLKIALAKYGISLSEETLEIDMLSIKQR